MMRATKTANFLIAALILFGVTAAEANGPKNKAEQRVDEAARVIDEIMTAPDQGIPRELLSEAHCVAVIPSMKQAGFVVGGQYGKGVMTCRHPQGSGWTGPSTVRMEGGSFGLQIGASETDVVLLVMNERGAEKLMESKFTLGADASVAAGPVGRTAEAGTDALMHAKILAYSRSRGLFAGIKLDGATLRPDEDENRELYGRSVDHKAILNGQAAAPPSGNALAATLNKYSTQES
jgi:lipid-binding SYLF domain-containing protein